MNASLTERKIVRNVDVRYLSCYTNFFRLRGFQKSCQFLHLIIFIVIVNDFQIYKLLC